MSFDLGGLPGLGAGGEPIFDAEGRLIGFEGAGLLGVGDFNLNLELQSLGFALGEFAPFGFGSGGVRLDAPRSPTQAEINQAIQEEIDRERERERAAQTSDPREGQGPVGGPDFRLPFPVPIGAPITLGQAFEIALRTGQSVSTVCETQVCVDDQGQELPRTEGLPEPQECPPCLVPIPIPRGPGGTFDPSLVVRLALELGLEFPLDVTAFVTFLRGLSGLPGGGPITPTPGLQDAAALPGCSATFFQPERCCCRVCVPQTSCCGGGCGCGGGCC